MVVKISLDFSKKISFELPEADLPDCKTGEGWEARQGRLRQYLAENFFLDLVEEAETGERWYVGHGTEVEENTRLLAIGVAQPS